MSPSRPGRVRATLLLSACLVAPSACGKRGDPLPPLRSEPRAPAPLVVAQRGTAIEVRVAAPASSVDGAPLRDPRIELLRAETEGPLEQVGSVESFEFAPGESRLVRLPLAAPGTRLRLAARARDGRHVSRLTKVIALTAQAPPPTPTALTAEQNVAGVELTWQPAPLPPAPEPERPKAEGRGGADARKKAPPRPVPKPADARPGPTPEPPDATPEPAQPPPEAPLEPTTETPAVALPKPTPEPTPPQRGTFLYRRTEPGEYAEPLTSHPVEVGRLVDVPPAIGARVCYVARAVVARAPRIESDPSNEVCLTLRDLEPPATPVGLSVVAVADGLELSWSPAPADVVAHLVYRQGRTGPARRLVQLPGEATRYVDADAPPGRAVSYLVVARDAAGNESAAASSPVATRR